MKILSIFLFLFGFYFVSYSQLQYEDFNATTIPIGWTATTTANGCAWQFGFTGSLPGSGFLTPSSFPTGGVVFDDGACGHEFNNLITLTGPEINLVNAGVTSAAIEVTYNHQAFNTEGNFLIDVYDGASWINVLLVDDDTPETNSGLNETTTIDVSAYINGQFKVKFTWDDENSNQSWGLGIDEYKLENTATVGIEDLSSEFGLSYYPNPILNNELTINAKETISSINVFNAIGELLVLKNPKTLQSKIYFENLPTGIYIVKVAIRDKKGFFKVIKK